MIEKVLNETSVMPKITLTQTEYNRLVELAQAYLTTCRSGDWVDAMCNSIGVLLGAIIGKTVICIVERRKSVLSTH